MATTTLAKIQQDIIKQAITCWVLKNYGNNIAVGLKQVVAEKKKQEHYGTVTANQLTINTLSR